MIAPVSPCKGCKDRHTNCHTTCKKYIEFTKANAEHREARRKYLTPYRQLIDMRQDQQTKNY